MRLTEALLRRAEEALTFDPRQQRRALLDRTAVAVADAPTLRRRIAQALGEGADAAQLAIDRLIGGTDQLNVSYLERGMIAADAVARIEVRNGDSDVIGCATGFMISPRLLLTNHHVLPTADDAAQSWIQFRHEYNALGRLVEPCTFALEPSSFFCTDPELDVTAVAVAPETPDRRQRVAHFGWLRLATTPDIALPGEWLTMVHHPGGGPKQVSLRQNLLIEQSARDLWYATETAAGSSGAPVFNDSWQVVAVHRTGVPARDPSGAILTVDGEPWTATSDESRIVWRAGLGTPGCAILARLATGHGDHPLIMELLAECDADAADAIVIPLGAGAERAPSARLAEEPPTAPRDALVPNAETTLVPSGNGTHGDLTVRELSRRDSADGDTTSRDATSLVDTGALTVTVPLRITVRAGNGSGRRPAVGVDVS